MSSSHKPEAYTTVSPYLIVDGASRTIEFLVRALDEGAKSVQEPVKGQDEDKRGGVMDAGGTT